jgi:pimeloyl-ACP methyl ester carboxylesterase
MKLPACLCCLAILLSPAVGSSQSMSPADLGGLPRHGVIGLAVAAPDPAKPENPETNPPTVKSVVPGSAAEAAGIQPSDILRQLDGQPVPSAAEFAKKISAHLAGDSVTIDLLRGAEKISKSVTLKPRPLETSADADVLYRAITVEGARRRTIITHPKDAGRHPAVLLVGGLGCYSLDGALRDPSAYGPILSALAKNGYVTMRVEKTGEGDSEGPACTDAKATAHLEAQGYRAGLEALRSYDFVDSASIFVFAHSLGPLVASLAFPQQPLKGFIAAETIGRSWFEYGLENVRRQSALVGEPLDEVDSDVRTHAECAFHFFLQHESAEEIAKLGTQCTDMIRSYAGMSDPYMHQIGDINLAKQWKQIDAPALVIYGTSDPATSADEGRYLVDVINSFHPGRATYAEVAGMGHDFGKYSSQSEFLDRRKDPNPHPFAEELLPVILGWLNQHVKS